MSRHVLLLLAAHLIVAAAQRNITIDDVDPLITYTGTWTTPPSSQLDYGGSHHLAEDDASFATFTFTGTAVYFMSPLWPYGVFTRVQLDSQPPVELRLSDPNPAALNVNGEETVRSAIIWGSGPLPNAAHTLRVSKIPRLDTPYSVVDAIIYTVLDSSSTVSSPSSLPPPPSSPSSVPSAPSSTPTSSSSSSTRSAVSPTNTSDEINDGSSSSNHVLPIALGTVLGSLGLLVLAVVLWLCCKGRRRPKSETWTVAGASGGASPQAAAPPPGPLSTNQPQPQIQHPYNPYPNQPYQQPYGHSPDASWSQMSTAGVPLVANAQPAAYYNNQPPPPQPQPGHDFDPWIGLAPMGIPMQQGMDSFGTTHNSFHETSGRYAPTTLSTITETSTPAGTVASNRSPLGASPASFPSADLSYYTPPQDMGGNPGRLSYASDGSGGASAAYQQQQYLYSRGSAGQLRPQGSPVTPSGGFNTGPPRW